MTSPARFAILASLLICCAFADRAQTKPGKDRATVSGKVTIKGKPALGIVVGIRLAQPDQSSATFKATTDQEGNYHINNLPTGVYQVAPVARSFVLADANNQQAQTVIITGTDDIEGVDFNLIRGGVITGKVTDANGDPVMEERVTFSSVADQPDPRRTQISGSSQTDDRGIYRMFGIRPGRYKVFVGQDGIGSGYMPRGRPPLPQSFYRDPADSDKPGIIEIEEGTEASKIDITVGPAGPSFSASGRVVDQETGKPVPNIAIGLTRIVTMEGNNTRGYGVAQISADAQGEFHFQNLLAGKYEATLNDYQSDLRVERTTFDIVDQDVSGLIVKASKGASVTGVVVVEGKREATVDALLFRAWLSVTTRNENPNITSSRGVSLLPDGSFHVGGLQPGLVTFSVETRGSQRYTITRIERDGVVLPSGIQIQSAEQVNGIRLFVTSFNGSIRGVVKTENGTLPPGARFVVQISKPGEPSMPMHGSEVDVRGHFLIEGLATGSYQVTVFAYIPGSRRPPSARVVVDVTDGAPTDVAITLDLTPTTSP
jgi:protocatechuate 3,4-dioxygenase beta subunit